MIQRIFRNISVNWLKIWRVYWRGHLISFHVVRFYHTIIIFINDTEIKAHVDTIGTYPNRIPYLCNKYHSLLYNSFDSSSGVYPRFGSYRPMYHYALHKTRNIVTPLMQRENHGELKGYLSQIQPAELRARILFFFFRSVWKYFTCKFIWVPLIREHFESCMRKSKRKCFIRVNLWIKRIILINLCSQIRKATEYTMIFIYQILEAMIWKITIIRLTWIIYNDIVKEEWMISNCLCFVCYTSVLPFSSQKYVRGSVFLQFSIP